jgi:hypothetical protein
MGLCPLSVENATVSCTGRIFRNPDILKALRPEEDDDGEHKEDSFRALNVQKYGMDKYCMQAQLNLKDIGLEGR